MKNRRRAFMLFAALALAALSLSTPWRLVKAQRNGGGGGSTPITYLATKKVDVVDDYFGSKVADPYLWLDSVQSTAHWTSGFGACPPWYPKCKYILYGSSQCGSYWSELYVLDVASRKPL